MIWESGPWKIRLWKIADRLSGRSNQKRWPESSLSNLEIDIFLAFYGIRKLLDSHKLSTNIQNIRFELQTYRSTGKNVTHMNWHRLNKLYDFSHEKTVVKKLRWLCNKIIHSFVYCPVFEDSTLKSIMFSSKKERNKQLYVVNLSDIISTLRKIGKDDPDQAHMIWDKEKKDYKITLLSHPTNHIQG